jgi:AdoMet-dependent rRNA methyltransferase SPB1|eukprot:31234-Pelagococcus_subviridis.AAC.1
MDLDNHPATTDEIRALCKDLGVLGRVDFKLLLKWRLAVRKTHPGLDGKPAKKPAGAADSGDEDDEDDAGAADAEEEEEDEDEKLLEEMDELRRVLSSHRSPYDRVGVVNADP